MSRYENDMLTSFWQLQALLVALGFDFKSFRQEDVLYVRRSVQYVNKFYQKNKVES